MIPNVPSSVKELFSECGKDETFLGRYVINAVLSHIEEREQELILGMRYDEWIVIDNDERNRIRERIINYLSRFSRACRGRDLSEDEVKGIESWINREHVIEWSICYLYLRGIYDDCVSRYLLINLDTEDTKVPDLEIDGVSNDPKQLNELCKNANNELGSCIKALVNRKFDVRSRFIEIARDLFKLKQRFPDISVFESPQLTSRVFAYAHPRELPLGKYEPKKALEKLENALHDFFRKYYIHFAGNDQGVDEAWKEYWEIINEFFNKALSNVRLYEFQVRGIETAFRKLTGLIGNGANEDYLVIEAPTGSGKTEIMVLTLIFASTARKIILRKLGADDSSKSETPIGVIIYPRRALANDQVSRLIRYLYYINEILSSRGYKSIRLTIDYTDIRHKSEYEEFAKSGRNEGYLKYHVPVRKEDNRIYLKFLQCPSGGNPYFTFTMNNGNAYVNDETVYCEIDGQTRLLNFIALTKDRVKVPGDIHITIFETMRDYLHSGGKSKFFGIARKIGNRSVFDSPLIIVLDEIHTYVDVPGVRYSFVLRRILNRIRYETSKEGGLGQLIMGMSATIPRAGEFLSKLFSSRINDNNLSNYVVKIERDETIPLGNEYFFIVVPTNVTAVDALTISIQTIMDVYYNLPSLRIGNEWRKKAIVFLEEINVLRRARHDLENAIRREVEEGSHRLYGLQDLRNPRFMKVDDSIRLFERTMNEYGEDNKDKVIEEVRNGKISRVPQTRSWRDGELWWGYMLDTVVNGEVVDGGYVTTRLHNVAEYSSRRREDIGNANIIVSTSSLEVGVDYSDVVFIYQHGAPVNIASLVQRAGRGGRRVHENPLIRVAIGIQLSNEIPHQSWLFEIFTRVKDLREALNYDRLFLPLRSDELIKQTLVELMIEYYAIRNKHSWNKCLRNKEKFECYLYKFYSYSKNRDEFAEYANYVFRDVKNKKELRNLIEELVQSDEVFIKIKEACGEGDA